MTSQHRDVQRKIKVLRHAEQTGCVARTWCLAYVARLGSSGGNSLLTGPAKATSLALISSLMLPSLG
jgi:hypothetical protein